MEVRRLVPGGARERRFVGLHLIFPQIPWVKSHGIASLGTIAGLVRRPIVHARPHRRVIRPPADRLRGRGPGRMYRNGDGQTATEPTPLDLNFFLSRFTEESPFWGQWLLVTARDVNGLVDRYGITTFGRAVNCDDHNRVVEALKACGWLTGKASADGRPFRSYNGKHVYKSNKAEAFGERSMYLAIGSTRPTERVADAYGIVTGKPKKEGVLGKREARPSLDSRDFMVVDDDVDDEKYDSMVLSEQRGGRGTRSSRRIHVAGASATEPGERVRTAQGRIASQKEAISPVIFLKTLNSAERHPTHTGHHDFPYLCRGASRYRILGKLQT